MNEVSEPSVQAHLTYNLANARIRNWPFPHLFFENVFPDDFYAGLMDTMPGEGAYSPIGKLRNVYNTVGTEPYPDRFVMRLDENMTDCGRYWNTAMRTIRSAETAATLLDHFGDTVGQRLTRNATFEPDSILIRDKTNYKLGPHTDNPVRFVVLIVYLPETRDNEHLGTSIYVPKTPGFTCEGGPHHKTEDFTRVFTAPYRPNSALAFVKTDNSFHGVEPVNEGEERNIIHLYLRQSSG